MNKALQGILAACLLLMSLSACANTPSAAVDSIITTNPRDLLLQPVDFQNGSAYFIPEVEAFPIPNEMAISAFGKEKGEELVTEEERVIGWRVHYQANEPDQAGPQVYLITIVQHQSAQGAKTAVQKYNNAALFPEGGWTIQDDKLELGDVNVVQVGATEDPQGRKAINYRIEFAYRNISADVLVFGLEKNVTLETAVKAAKAVLLKIKAAPVGKGPVPTPSPLTAQ